MVIVVTFFIKQLTNYLGTYNTTRSSTRFDNHDILPLHPPRPKCYLQFTPYFHVALAQAQRIQPCCQVVICVLLYLAGILTTVKTHENSK